MQSQSTTDTAIAEPTRVTVLRLVKQKLCQRDTRAGWSGSFAPRIASSTAAGGTRYVDVGPLSRPSCLPLSRTPRLGQLKLRAHRPMPHDGRSPDSRIKAHPNLPRLTSSGLPWGHSPPTVAGAVTDLEPQSRTVPCSHFISPTHVFENHQPQLAPSQSNRQ